MKYPLRRRLKVELHSGARLLQKILIAVIIVYFIYWFIAALGLLVHPLPG
jgi:hypothetical protein